MQNVEGSDHEKRIKEELRWCYTFEEGKKCIGAGGRKLRQICVWCPNYQKERRMEEDEKGG